MIAFAVSEQVFRLCVNFVISDKFILQSTVSLSLKSGHFNFEFTIYKIQASSGRTTLPMKITAPVRSSRK